MEWKLQGGLPVYQQIFRQLRDGVLSQEYPPGSPVPSIRELAAQAKVNPNTMERALWLMEREGYIVSGETGPCFAGDEEILKRMYHQQLDEVTKECAGRFACVGLTPEQGAQLLMRLTEKEVK